MKIQKLPQMRYKNRSFAAVLFINYYFYCLMLLSITQFIGTITVLDSVAGESSSVPFTGSPSAVTI